MYRVGILLKKGGSVGNINNRSESNSRARANARSNSRSTSNIKNSGNSTVKNNVDASSRNKLNNKQNQKQSANNEGVSVVDNSSYTYKQVPQVAPTFPLNGTTSVTFSTLFGDGGFSKDSKDAKLISAGSFIQQVRSAKLLNEADAKEATLNIVNKLLKRACGRSCVLDIEDEKVDKEVTGNGGNL